MDRLTATLAEICADLTPEALERLADILDRCEEPGPAFRAHTQRALPGKQALLAPFDTAWDEHPEPPQGSTLAFTVRTALTTARKRQTKQLVELVWTGPAASRMTARHTEAALLDVIQAASEDLLVVTYATAKTASIEEVLRDALHRDVTVTAVCETTEDAPSHFNQDAKDVLGHLADEGDLRFYRWPATTRPGGAALHAKIAIADSNDMLVTSANLTDTAMRSNLEAGVRIRNGTIPQVLRDHFDHLIADGILARHLG